MGKTENTTTGNRVAGNRASATTAAIAGEIQKVNDTDLIGWLLGSVAIVVATLSGAITVLWSRSEARNAAEIERLQDRASRCENDRAELFRQQVILEERIRILERDDKNA